MCYSRLYRFKSYNNFHILHFFLLKTNYILLRACFSLQENSNSLLLHLQNKCKLSCRIGYRCHSVCIQKMRKCHNFTRLPPRVTGPKTSENSFVGLLVLLGREWWAVPGGWLHCRRFCSREKKQAIIYANWTQKQSTMKNEEEEEDRIGAELHELRCDAVIGEIFGHNRLRS